MGHPDLGDGTTLTAGRYGRDTVEFARVVNLSDAVFAIAMTLLVLGLQVPEVPVQQLGNELTRTLPQLVAFLLGFGLVASIWWQHHKLFSRLAYVDRGMVGLAIAVLAAVALVPFPTGLVGSYPTNRAAVLPFIGVFAVLNALFVAMVWHAQRQQAWSRALPAATFPWVVGGFGLTLGVTLIAVAAATMWPVAALVVLAVSGLPDLFLAHRAPPDYREWS
jgi:uncharacterized membrane protein